jgi:hypothetical protein
MIVTCWSNGRPRKTGSGYGIKIRKYDRDRYFSKHWKSVIIIIPIIGKIVTSLSPSFWRECVEIRSKHIGLFFIHNKLHKWRRGRPHALNLSRVGYNEFKLKK